VNDLALLPVRDAFRAIATTVVPELAVADGDTWEDTEEVIEGVLATRPPALRRQLLAFVQLVNLLPLLRYGRRFTSLDAERRTRVLAQLQHAPLLLIRRGVWGIRTLIMLGYYARPTAAAEIGYRADPSGWEARR
jgi:hypothetical protein